MKSRKMEMHEVGESDVVVYRDALASGRFAPTLYATNDCGMILPCYSNEHGTTLTVYDEAGAPFHVRLSPKVVERIVTAYSRRDCE